jgi:hypothetical protein
MSAEVMRVITERGPKPIGLNGRIVQHWFWKFVPVDPLIFSSPNHDGSTVQIARQVYHRMIGRMVAENAHGMQTGIIGLAWLLTFLLGHRFVFRGGDTSGTVLGLAAFGASVFFAIPVLMRIACPASAREEAESIVRRTFLRNLPENTPPDLQDQLQQGWLTADGRPLSAEISAEDGRTLEATRRSIWWLVTAFAVAWAVAYLFTSPARVAPAPSEDALPPGFPFPGAGVGLGAGSLIPGLGLVSSLGSLMVILILLIKLFFDKRPLALRAKELDLAAAVEGTAFVAAGGQSWGTIAEAARQRQVREAAGDSSPTVELGETTGVFAGRGDFFGPSAGLPFRLSLRDLQMHLLVLGGTGSGKTSGVLRPIARQLSAFDKVGLVIMDGKGSLPAELARLPGMRVVDPGQSGTEVSLVSGVEPAVIVETIREILASSEGGEDQFWVNSAASVLRRGAVIAQAAGGAWWSLFHSVQLVSRKDERDRVIDALLPKTETDPLLREACAYFRGEWDTQMDERTRSNILAVIRSWLSTITATPELLRWARTPAGTDTVDIMSPMTGGRIGFLIPEHRYGTAGSVVTALIKARLYNGLKARADRDWSAGEETPVVFIVDEAQEVATSQDAQMLAIGRSLGLAMVAATQGLEGVKAKLGEATSDKWLAIFGGVVALGGRSLTTDTFVAQRAGECWQLTPTDVEGATVRGSLSMEAMSGPAAAARTQPHMDRIAGGGRWSGPSELASALASLPAAMFRGKTPKMDVTSRLTLGPRPLVVPGEIASITAVPDTAVVIATRGRVPRRDVVQLRPEYVASTRTTGAEVRQTVAQPQPQAAPASRAPVSAQPAPSVAATAAVPVVAAPKPAPAPSPVYEPAPAVVGTIAPGESPKCPSCAAEITETGVAFCTSCGAKLS